MSALVFIFQLIVFILTLPIQILHYIGVLKSITNVLFPYFLDRMTDSYNKLMEKEKKSLFSNMSDFAGPSKELRLLEIGCGTGANFKFYPSGCKVNCLDINPNFQKFLSKNQALNDHLKYEGFLVASADNMTPVADASMDVVVCTLLACSLPNTPAMLKEVKRVLRPGGVYYFIEHVASTDESSWMSFFQKVMNHTWGAVFAGCSIRKTTWKDLEDAKFSELSLRHIYVPTKFILVNPHIIGYAVK
ncbi:thiol S-methyltransferase TMT1A-like [Hyperolius riggenbachi]|uniref:thiol S-methyltransferase TMT1A-like n=1 Tax=Hyperolius riggenbachi TaxID=752182 RepID=UPI0035A2841C